MRTPILALALCALGLMGAFGQARKTILVTPLASPALSEEERRLITDAVISRIMASTAFAVVSESSRELALAEIERSQSELFAERMALDAGRLAESDLVLSMSVAAFGTNRAYAVLRLTDVKSGKVERSASQEFSGMDRIAERLQGLVAKTLQIGEAEAVLPSSEELVYVTPSQHRVFQGLTFGYHSYDETTAGHKLAISSLSVGTNSIYGRPLGFLIDASFLLPLRFDIDGVRQDWLYKFGVPWGVDMYAGASYLASAGDSLLVGLSGGFHFAEYLVIPPSKFGSPEVTAYFNNKQYNPFYWNYGVFLGIHALVRGSSTGYLRIGCMLGYDLQAVLPALNSPDYLIKGAWSISPTIALASGK
jgi:hypothetical protein